MTKELIEEARDMTLYARTTKHGAVSHADMIDDLADALEASLAARQPSGDDREALIDVVKRNRSVVKRMSDGYPSVAFVTDETIADAILAAGFSRAAIPDAATERERSDLWQSLDWMLWGVGMGDVFREPLADKMIGSLSDEEFDKAQDLIRGWDKLRGGPIERNLFVELKAERDAALAAIERVRAAVSGHPECDRYEEGDVISCGWKSAYASVVAALDGAPEPEWEYARENRYESVCEPDDSREQAEYRAALGGGYDTVVRRRPAGPWLPIGGDDK